MPCLFFRNVPAKVKFDPDACEELYRSVAVAARVSINDVEVHIEDTQYKLLGQNGKLYPHGVHVFVEWFGRPQETKDQVAEAIDQFLAHHDLWRGSSNITFRDYHSGAFYEEGLCIPGGLPRGWV